MSCQEQGCNNNPSWCNACGRCVQHCFCSSTSEAECILPDCESPRYCGTCRKCRDYCTCSRCEVQQQVKPAGSQLPGLFITKGKTLEGVTGELCDKVIQAVLKTVIINGSCGIKRSRKKSGDRYNLVVERGGVVLKTSTSVRIIRRTSQIPFADVLANGAMFMRFGTSDQDMRLSKQLHRILKIMQAQPCCGDEHTPVDGSAPGMVMDSIVPIACRSDLELFRRAGLTPITVTIKDIAGVSHLQVYGINVPLLQDLSHLNLQNERSSLCRFQSWRAAEGKVRQSQGFWAFPMRVPCLGGSEVFISARDLADPAWKGIRVPAPVRGHKCLGSESDRWVVGIYSGTSFVLDNVPTAAGRHCVTIKRTDLVKDSSSMWWVLSPVQCEVLTWKVPTAMRLLKQIKATVSVHRLASVMMVSIPDLISALNTVSVRLVHTTGNCFLPDVPQRSEDGAEFQPLAGRLFEGITVIQDERGLLSRSGQALSVDNSKEVGHIATCEEIQPGVILPDNKYGAVRGQPGMDEDLVDPALMTSYTPRPSERETSSLASSDPAMLPNWQAGIASTRRNEDNNNNVALRTKTGMLAPASPPADGASAACSTTKHH